MSYSFKQPQYPFTPISPSVSVSPVIQQPGVAPQMPPPIGPEIGPDPRNAQCTVRLGETFNFEENGFRYDFTFGFRISMPPQGKFHLRVTDAETGCLYFEQDVPAGASVVGDRKYYIPYLMEVTDPDTGKILFSHRFDCKGKKVYVIVPDGGLGENFAWMPYAEEFRRVHHADVTCVLGEWFIRMIADRYPKLKFQPISTIPETKDGYAAYFCAVFPKERSSWRPVSHHHFGMQKSIAQALGLPLEYLRVRIKLDAPRTIAEPYVCISSMGTNPDKHWNCPDGWNTIIRFLKSIGYRVFDIDREKELFFAGKRFAVPTEAEDETGRKPISQRIALLQHADFFIGLPSGLSWVAWNCRIPVVMLTGFSMEGAEFPTPYRITNFNFCHGCWSDNQEYFDTKVPVWCPRQLGTDREIECTRVITPAMVKKVLLTIPCVQKRMAEAEKKK